MTLSACAVIKEGSLTNPTGETCALLGLAVPPGSPPPSTITAAPSAGGSPIVFSRNDQVAAEIAAATALARQEEPEVEAWPPAGLEGVGYLSGPVKEIKGSTVEWTVDADFGLPTPSDGGPFAGPFKTAPAYGARIIDAERPADRPVHCLRPEDGPDLSAAFCVSVKESAGAGTSDLKIAAAPTTSVFVGGKAQLPYGFNFASTTPSLPSFNVSASSNLAGAGVTVSAPSFTPPAVDPGTHRSSGTDTVTVAVPKDAKPVLYEVTVTAKTAQGSLFSQVAKFEVTQAKVKLGKAKLNKRNGTAKLSVGVPGAGTGTLTTSGKGIVKAQRKATGPTTLKVTIKAKGKAKKKLNATGKAKVKAKIVFAPENGAPVTKTKSIVLKKKLP